MYRRASLVAALAATTFARAATAQQESRPDELRATRPVVAVRQLGSVVRSDSTALLAINGVRHLPNGSVIVNDATKRQLVLFDSTLATFAVIADTSTNSPNSYGMRGFGGSLIPYIADSSLFVDQESQAFLVIDPQGRFTRVMAPVRPTDLGFISSGAYGSAGFDPQGRLLYRSARRAPFTPMAFDATNTRQVSIQPDSAPIMRADFDKRTVDTIVFLKIPIQKSIMVRNNQASFMYYAFNPLPQTDEWTLLPDGTIAIVRGQDYHIDWLAPDGTLTSSPRLPFDWKRITLEEKQALIDSVRKENAEREAKMPPPPPPTPGQPVMPRMVFTTVEATDLPDYYPAVRQGQVRADLDGNVWVLPSTTVGAAQGALLYDVIDRRGLLVERVQLPPQRTLVGFGPKGVIYMAHYRNPRSSVLERAVVLRPSP